MLKLSCKPRGCLAARLFCQHPRHIKTLEEHINNLEKEHDALNLQWSKGEISGYGPGHGAETCCESIIMGVLKT